MGEWISVKNRLPADNTMCDIWSNGERITDMVYSAGKFFEPAYPEYQWSDPVSHWMPLPPPPEQESE